MGEGFNYNCDSVIIPETALVSFRTTLSSPENNLGLN
jgi:hypothetical protein